jgi:hypothetical protein
MAALPEFDWFHSWQAYEQAKVGFLARHPDATPEQIEEFCKKKAEELGL